MSKILIVAPYQFGELSDCYYWAKYSKENNQVWYIGYRQRNSSITSRSLEGIKIWQPVKFKNNILFGAYFYLNVIFKILINKIDNVIICNMPYAELLPLLFKRKNIVFDIRTLSVVENEEIRLRADTSTIKRARCFKHVSVISNGLIRKIALNNTSLLPLGAEELSLKNKKFDIMRMMYIGTFNGRKLEDFLQGVLMFKMKYKIQFTCDIIGNGDPQTTKKIQNIAKEIGSEVVLHGYLNHEESQLYFDNCNIGICYVPQTEYYEEQPATKLYEYFLSGMAAIATSTHAIKEDMLLGCGVLIEDNPNSVCEGLKKMHDLMPTYESSDIRKKSQKYHWSLIFEHNFLSLFS